MDKVPMKLKIIKTGLDLFLKKGFTNTTSREIATELGISNGNLTFHYPTKEDLLLELVGELCDFQWKLIKHYLEEGEKSLFAYCMELSTMAWACELHEYAKDIYLAAYRHDKTLKKIRENDTIKLKEIFNEYHKDWNEREFRNAEYLISGIEYAILCSSNDQNFPIKDRIDSSLTMIMNTFGVSQEEQKIKLNKIHNVDCKALGEKVLNEFVIYVDKVNQEAIEENIKTRKKTRVDE